MSVEEKIKRAEEIYNRRKGVVQNNNYTTRVNVNTKRDLRLFKKMICQIIVCLSIYFCYYLVNNNNYVFSKDLINKTQEILSYDIDFNQVYNTCKNYINGIYKTENAINVNIIDNTENNENHQNNSEGVNNNVENNVEQNKEGSTNDIYEEEQNIGGAEATNLDSYGQNKIEETNSQEQINQNKELSQEEQDIIDIKNSINFIKPIEGSISSGFGWRNPTTATVPKYHTGLDIVAITGTVIKSATDGTVSMASSEGDYRKSFKNNKWRCNNNLCTL